MIKNIVRNVFLGLVFSLLIILPQKSGECFVTVKYQDVPLKFSAIRVPQALYVSEYDFTPLAEKYSGTVSESDRKTLENIKVYQMAINDGGVYRTALFAYWLTDERADRGDEKDFAEPISAERRQKILKEQADVRASLEEVAGKGQAFWAELRKQGKMRKVDFFGAARFSMPHVLAFEMPDVEFFTIDNKQAYAASFRAMVDWSGIFMMGYIKGYAFRYDEKIAVAAFITADGEREFWTDIFDHGIRNIKFTAK